MMDTNDDLLFREWEDDSSVMWENFDDTSSSFHSYTDSQISQVSKKGETFFKQIDEDLDYAFALSLQTEYDDEVKENITFDSKKSYIKDSKKSKPLSIIDEQWELIDPHPDIHALFQNYDVKFFFGKLKQVEVKWSSRMTLCAGVCSYEGRGGLCSIRLSMPLLKLRPRKDLVETLLHEMIHAYLFVTHNNKDRDGHGPEFLSHMHRINKESGTRITVYHSFHDEVDLYRQHWWKCNGPCRKKHPYYGVLKRAMNRAPGPKDNWWADHQASCGGTFVKIKEPASSCKKSGMKRKADTESKKSATDIRSFFKDDMSQNDNSRSVLSTVDPPHSDSSVVNENNIATLNSKNIVPKKQFIPFQGTGQKLGGSFGKKAVAAASSAGKALGVTPLPGISKVPRLSPYQRNESMDHKPSTSGSSNDAPRNLLQSPMEKFLSSKSVTNDHKKNDLKNQFNVLERDSLKVSCPVCFILIKEQEINSHLDTCLSK